MATNSSSDPSQVTYSATASTLIGLVGIPANIVVLALSIAQRNQQNGYWIFIANLALADGLLLVNTVTLQMANVEKIYICGFQPTAWRSAYLIVITYVPSLISYTVLVWSGVKVWIKLREYQQQLQLSTVTNPQTASHTRQLLKLVVVFSLLPILLEIPAFVVKLVAVNLAYPLNPWIPRIFLSMFYLNSALNPYITIACMKPYSVAVQKGIRRACMWLRHQSPEVEGAPIAVIAVAPVTPQAASTDVHGGVGEAKPDRIHCPLPGRVE